MSARAGTEDADAPMAEPALLSSGKFAGIEVANRVAMAPLTRGRATEGGVPTDIMRVYYAERASAGLIISEATTISKQASGWFRAPGIYTDEQVEAWKPIVDAVHARGGKIAVQLWHMGRQCSSQLTRLPIVSSSDIPLDYPVAARNGENVPPEVPHSLTVEEIKGVLRDFAAAAKNAMVAGFDLIELHGANGYLIDQFSQASANRRTDEYGGSMENRLRFMNEVMDAVIDAVGSSRKVGIRISPNGMYGNMGGAENVELFSLALKNIAERKLGFVHIIDGLDFGFHGKCEQFTLAMARKILGDQVSIMGNCGYTKETAAIPIKAGDADMIAFGRPYIANADLVERFRSGKELAPDRFPQFWWLAPKDEIGYTDFSTPPSDTDQVVPAGQE